VQTADGLVLMIYTSCDVFLCKVLSFGGSRWLHLL